MPLNENMRADMSTAVCIARTEVMSGSFWIGWREEKGEEVEEHLDYEVRGIHEILKNCSLLNVRMSGVYIDGHLEAFTIGSYNPLEQMAVIHIEKQIRKSEDCISLLISNF